MYRLPGHEEQFEFLIILFSNITVEVIFSVVFDSEYSNLHILLQLGFFEVITVVPVVTVNVFPGQKKGRKQFYSLKDKLLSTLLLFGY